MRRRIIISIIVFGIVALLAALAIPSLIKYGENKAEMKRMACERAAQIRHMQFTGESVESNTGDRQNDTPYFKGHGKGPLKSDKVRGSSTVGMAAQSNNR